MKGNGTVPSLEGWKAKHLSIPNGKKVVFNWEGLPRPLVGYAEGTNGTAKLSLAACGAVPGEAVKLGLAHMLRQLEELEAAGPANPARRVIRLTGFEPLGRDSTVVTAEQILKNDALATVIVSTTGLKGANVKERLARLSELSKAHRRVNLEIHLVSPDTAARVHYAKSREMFAVDEIASWAASWAKGAKNFRPFLVVDFGPEYPVWRQQDFDSFRDRFGEHFAHFALHPRQAVTAVPWSAKQFRERCDWFGEWFSSYCGIDKVQVYDPEGLIAR